MKHYIEVIGSDAQRVQVALHGVSFDSRRTITTDWWHIDTLRSRCDGTGYEEAVIAEWERHRASPAEWTPKKIPA